MGKTRATASRGAEEPAAARGKAGSRGRGGSTVEEDEAALARALKGLEGVEGERARRAVRRWRALATKPRPRPETERDRILQAIEDADRDYQVAVADHSHQAADRNRRHKAELEEELKTLGREEVVRGEVKRGDPDAGRVVWMRQHLEQIEADLEYLRRTEQWTTIPALERAAVEQREELDKARKEDAGALELDRSPAAVARRVLERHARLQELAALERR